MAASTHQQWLADLLTLVHHEARNVRHIIQVASLDKDAWRRFISLPRNREEAWASLKGLRQRAVSGTSANAVDAFQRTFGVTLSDLEEMYRSSSRQGSQRGGNRWAAITAAVRRFADALVAGDVPTAEAELQLLKTPEHNTGSLSINLSVLIDRAPN